MIDQIECENRFTKLETEMKNVSQQLEKITTNDLPHIQAALKSAADVLSWVKGRQSIILALVLSGVASIVGLYALVIEIWRAMPK